MTMGAGLSFLLFFSTPTPFMYICSPTRQSVSVSFSETTRYATRL